MNCYYFEDDEAEFSTKEILFLLSYFSLPIIIHYIS